MMRAWNFLRSSHAGYAFRTISAGFAISVLLVGCAPRTPAAKFYLLQPIDPQAARTDPSAVSFPYAIGMGPIDLPAYLDRPQIVSGGPGANVQFDEFRRWAEPLRDTIVRVLAENLASLMPDSHVLTFPWNRTVTPAYQVEARVLRFHVDQSGNCELKADWIVLRNRQPVSIKEFRTRIPASGHDFESKVDAQSEALAAFSREIARSLRTMATP